MLRACCLLPVCLLLAWWLLAACFLCACCLLAALLLRACRLGAFRSLRASSGSNAPRIPPGRFMIWVAGLRLNPRGLGLWTGLSQCAVLAWLWALGSAPGLAGRLPLRKSVYLLGAGSFHTPPRRANPMLDKARSAQSYKPCVACCFVEG